MVGRKQMADVNTLETVEWKGYLWISLPGLINRDNIIQIQREIETLVAEGHIKVQLRQGVEYL